MSYEPIGDKEPFRLFRIMPRFVTTAEYLVGYVSAKMEQFRTLVHRMENRCDFTRSELSYIQQEILDIDLEVQTQGKLVTDTRIKEKMVEYKRLFDLAERWYERRIRELGPESSDVVENFAPATEDDAPNQDETQMQFGDVDMSLYREPKPSAADLEPYASDEEGAVQLEYLSKVVVTIPYKPIQFPRPRDLVETDAGTSESALRQMARQAAEEQRVLTLRADRRRDEPIRSAQNGVRSRSEHGRNESARSQSSVSSYVSTQQETFSQPISGVPYPPIQRTPPIQISRKDPSLIGRTEIFVHPPAPAKICPICTGYHKMHRCTTVLRAGLQERWFLALRAGVCLNCLLRGHSHYRCQTPGACYRCSKRHNSVLCPENRNND